MARQHAVLVPGNAQSRLQLRPPLAATVYLGDRSPVRIDEPFSQLVCQDLILGGL
jgi:hypothetical protein